MPGFLPGVLPVSACQWPWDQSSTPSSSCLSLLCFPPPYPQTRTGSPIHRSRGISELVKHGWREWGERKERGAAVAGRGASGRTTERSRFRDGFLRVTFWGGRDLFFLLRGHARPFSFIFSSEVTPVPFLLSSPRSRPSLSFYLFRGHARPFSSFFSEVTPVPWATGHMQSAGSRSVIACRKTGQRSSAGNHYKRQTE